MSATPLSQELRGQRLVVQRGPKHAHSIPQYAIRRRLSTIPISHASKSSPAASPATLPIPNSTDRACTMPALSGCRPVTRPVQLTQIRTLVPGGMPVLAGTMPSLDAPEGARHRPATQKVAIDP